jgi:hypothetical protein
MDQPVNKVEVQVAEHRHQEHHGHKVDRMLLEAHEWYVAVGEGPERDRLVGGPDRHATAERPYQVVDRLVAEQESGAVGRQPLAIELELRPLLFLDIEAQVKRAKEGEDDHGVAGEKIRDPAGGKGSHCLHRRRQVQPQNDADCGIDQVPRQDEARVAEEPFQETDRLERPNEDRRILDPLRRLPIAALVALSVNQIIHGASTLDSQASCGIVAGGAYRAQGEI